MQIYVTNVTKMNTNAPKNVRYDCKKSSCVRSSFFLGLDSVSPCLGLGLLVVVLTKSVLGLGLVLTTALTDREHFDLNISEA